jgi:hypothetical protein
LEEQVRGREIKEEEGDEKGQGRNMRYEKCRAEERTRREERKGKKAIETRERIRDQERRRKSKRTAEQEIGKEGINQGAMEEGENMEQKKIKKRQRSDIYESKERNEQERKEKKIKEPTQDEENKERERNKKEKEIENEMKEKNQGERRNRRKEPACNYWKGNPERKNKMSKRYCTNICTVRQRSR